jgi:SPX domain protein involved in polyphosphate accumulation
MKIIKRHDDVSEQKYRALFVPKLKAQPFFNERHPPMRS